VNFTDSDKEQIKSKGLTIDAVRSQIDVFKKEIPFVVLRNAATLDNGILKLSEFHQTNLAKLYESRILGLETIKFVPGSGAATRMFKELFRFLDHYNYEKESLNSYTNYEKANAIRLFLIGLEKFPFYEIVMNKVREAYPKFESLSEGKQLYIFVEMMLREKGLNYGDFPKGLLPFHRYSNSVSTAFEEHLYEAVGYNTNNEGVSKLHFTVSKEHLAFFEEEFNRIKKRVEEKTNTTFLISYSFQNLNTDTIAVTEDNEPFRVPRRGVKL